MSKKLIKRLTLAFNGLLLTLVLQSAVSYALTASGNIQTVDLGGIDSNALVVVFTIDTPISGCGTGFTFSFASTQAAEAYYGALLTAISTGNSLEFIYTVGIAGLCDVNGVKLS